MTMRVVELCFFPRWVARIIEMSEGLGQLSNFNAVQKGKRKVFAIGKG